MKAYEVSYRVAGSSGHRTVVLVNHENDIPTALAEKDDNFEIDSRWCEIGRVKHKALSEVKLTDLSVADLLKILGK